MGLKFLLRLQVIPFCFHVAGGEITCGDLAQPPPTVKVIKSDGAVEIYDRPVSASEVMSRFPKHLICRSDSFYIGQKIPALSADDQLEPGDRYFLLPQQFFQNDLSFAAVAKLLRAPGSKQPFDVQRAPNGALRIRVSEEYFISRVVHQPDGGPGGASGLCTTAQLKKDYSALVGAARQWKPKLETIRESSKERNNKKKKRKISYTSSFKFRKSKSHKTSTSEEDGAGEKDNNSRHMSDVNSNNISNSVRIDDNAIRDTKVITKAEKKRSPSSSSSSKGKSRKG